MLKLKGIPINQGIVEGTVFIKVNPIKTLLTKKYTTIDPIIEIKNYLEVISSLQHEFQQLKYKNIALSNNTNQQMADLYIAILNDPVFKKRIPEHIQEQKIPASYIILQNIETIKQEFAKIDNEYFRSRFDDFESIGHKLLEILTGSRGYASISKPKVIVAENLSAADLLQLPLEFVQGIITADGGATSHAAILAEALDIPAIFGVKNIIEHANRTDTIIMDGYGGDVVINPLPETSIFYQNLIQRHLQYEETIIASAKDCHTTKDGHPISILANIGNIYDVHLIHKYNADGIGLLRTETIVLLEEELFSEEDQTIYYESFFKKTKNLPVSVRTLDLGGDKTIKNAAVTPLDEENPFLGFRSTRQFVRDPREFKKQIRALLRSYHINPNIKILIPFVTTLDDLLILKALVIESYKELYTTPFTIPIGIMAEVPSTLICLSDYFPHIDFISIGTNDLTQYVLATDRNNKYVSHYHNSAHPAIIKLLYHAGDQCLKHNIPLSICGEIAKEPHFIRLLYGLGIPTLSMSPTGIPMARYILANSTQEECQQLVKDILPMQHTQQIESYLHNDLINFLTKQNAYFDNCIINASNTTTRS